MIVVRNVFHLKFGKAREAVAAMKEGVAIQKRLGVDVNQRLLTDLTGSFYTLVLELTLPNLAALETTLSKVMRQGLPRELREVGTAGRVRPSRDLQRRR